MSEEQRQSIPVPPEVQIERLNNVLTPPPDISQRIIRNPYWANDARTCVLCEFVLPDGRTAPAAVNQSLGDAENPDWTEIMSQFTPADIDKYTRGKKQQAEEQERAKKAAHDAWEREQIRQQVYEAKLQALEDVPAIKNSKNQALKKRLRSAKTLVEVFAYATLLIQEDYLSSNQ